MEYELTAVCLPDHAPQSYRQRVWKLLEGNAKVGNLRPDMIPGNGMPDAIYYILREELLKELGR